VDHGNKREIHPVSTKTGKRARPFTVAVTGIPGSGKSTVCGIIETLGIPAIRADDLAREVVTPGSPALSLLNERFGPALLRRDGTLDRKALLDLILDDHCAKRDVEAVIHPAVRKRLADMLEQLATGGNVLVAVEVPLLFEAGWEAEFDYVVAVTAPIDTCIERLMNRKDITREVAERLIGLQMAQDEKARLADTVIVNDSTLKYLQDEVGALLGRIRDIIRQAQTNVLLPDPTDRRCRL